MYAYTLNNPGTFTDADGHEIVCANNAQQCQQDAASATGNAEAAQRVSTTTTTVQHSFLGIHWSTSKTVISISGDIGSFRALSQNSSRLADLVNSNQTVTVNYDGVFPGGWTYGGTILNGGSTSRLPSQGFEPQAWIDPANRSRNGAAFDSDAVSQRIPQASSAEEFGHEVLGHVWGELIGGHPVMVDNRPAPTARANMRDSITGENAVRKLDPARGQKGSTSHHNYNDMPLEKK